MKIPAHHKIFAWAAACAVVTASALQGQTVSNYTGATANNDNWTNTGNWDTPFFPDAPDALVQFGALSDPSVDLVAIIFSSSFLETQHFLKASAIMVLPTMNSEIPLFRLRSTQSATTQPQGTLQLFGHSTTIGGDPATLLIGNFASHSVRFEPANAGYKIELNSSGVVHNEGGLLRISTEITEAGGPQSITKTGEGTLRFDRWSAGQSSEHSTYSGGFIMQEGIVEWTNSGDRFANPFGIGPLTMQGGTFRSTTDTGRTLNSNIVLDGGATLGSQEEGHLGNVTVNSGGGNLATTIISDSTVTIFQTTNWHQAISGNFGLTKDGDGTLVFNGTGGDVTHTGATIVADGTLMVNTNVTDSDLSVASGATLAFGTTTGVGQGIFGQTVTLASDSILSFRLNGLDSFDSMLANGAVSLDGAILDIDLGFTPDFNDVFLLIDNQSGQALNGLLSYGGNTLAEGSEFTVTTGVLSQVFEITYLAGDGNSLALTAIPEPSTWALGAGFVVMALAAGGRFRRQPRL